MSSNKLYRSKPLVVVLAIFAPLGLFMANGFYRESVTTADSAAANFMFGYSIYTLAVVLVAAFIALRGIVYWIQTRNYPRCLC